MQTETFAERLKRIAREKDTSIDRLAHAVYDPQVKGTSPGNLKKIVRGERPINRVIVERLAAALGVPPEEFPEFRLLVARELLDERIVGLDDALDHLSLIQGALDGASGPQRSHEAAPVADTDPRHQSDSRVGRSRRGA